MTALDVLTDCMNEWFWRGCHHNCVKHNPNSSKQQSQYAAKAERIADEIEHLFAEVAEHFMMYA